MNISETIFQESHIILKSFTTGVILMVIYDVLRIFRHLIPHNAGFVAVEDLLFWLFSGITIFIMLYLENNGSLRGFSLWGVILGMVTYFVTLSPYLVKSVVFLLEKLWRFVSFPFRWIKKLCKK